MIFLLIKNHTVQDNKEKKSDKDFIRQSLKLIIVLKQDSYLSDLFIDNI